MSFKGDPNNMYPIRCVEGLCFLSLCSLCLRESGTMGKKKKKICDLFHLLEFLYLIDHPYLVLS